MGDTTKIVVVCTALAFGMALAAENGTMKIPDNLIKLMMPNGSVEISIKGQIGNESQRAMKLLLKSLKSAIDGLGYSLSRTTTNRLLNAARDLQIGVPGASDGNGSGSKEAIEGDLINSSPPADENLFTEFEEQYEYGHANHLDDSKPLDYAYPVDQDTSFQKDLDEQYRADLEVNYTSMELENKERIGDDNIDKYMLPAEDEYENFGKEPGNRPKNNIRANT
ncbi:hypothetical protein GE061_015672 [Apolygus lucorum]|uniref:Uncharacterized protein n=1 Tax=Apolygus lucorum TaxID=248454 RepID=A0A8S9XNW3_APOLU|nr:hypothetical protein GE061_015672 [Apolygus lucorum]